jgi:hypothetical protein
MNKFNRLGFIEHYGNLDAGVKIDKDLKDDEGFNESTNQYDIGTYHGAVRLVDLDEFVFRHNRRR